MSSPLQAGDALPATVTKVITQRQIDCYTPVRPGSIHSFPEAAAAKGYPATLAQGLMTAAYVSELMVRVFGEGFVVGGRMAITFILPVFVGDTITTSAVVREVVTEDDHARVVVELTCANQHGRTAVVGTASARQLT